MELHTRSDTTVCSLQQIYVKQEAPIRMCLSHHRSYRKKTRQQLATRTPTDMPNECNTRHDKVSSALLQRRSQRGFLSIFTTNFHHISYCSFNIWGKLVVNILRKPLASGYATVLKGPTKRPPEGALHHEYWIWT